jgi:PAS domain S-box-containing protein
VSSTNASANDGSELTPYVAERRADLAARCQQVLRTTLFTNRAEIRPAALKRMAEAEVDALLDFLRARDTERAQQHGGELCRAGLGSPALMALSGELLRFCADAAPREATSLMLAAGTAYQNALLQGYLEVSEAIVLQEQERIRSALQRTLNRYTVQMELAADIAARATSILNPHELLAGVADLIGERFHLQHVDVFLLDGHSQTAVLSATAGTATAALEPERYHLDLTVTSPVSECILRGEARIDVDTARSATTGGAYLKVAVPLRTRGRVIGALSLQSEHVTAFAAQDVPILQIMADQLATAIDNARLFSDLSQSEEKYRTILNSIEDGYYELDLENRFVFLNGAIVRLLGYPLPEILGRPYQRFVHADDAGALVQALARVSTSGMSVQSIEHRIVTKDGAERVVETSAALIRDAGDTARGLRGLVRDVTERYQAEQLLIERRALERSNRELGQFAYVASHDLQEPLHKIHAFGDRLKMRSGEALDEEGRDYLERMLAAVARMQSLIDGLLALSRISTKAQPFEPVDLQVIAREVVGDLETRLERTGGRVVVGELPTVEADPLQMRQLFQNLIGNSLKFHRPDEAPLVEVAAERADGRPGESYRIQFKDNGIGFDEKYLELIFKPFQRLHGRNEYEGSGIGLAICQRIVERHGGRLTAHSAPGLGATFVVTLPLHPFADGG